MNLLRSLILWSRAVSLARCPVPRGISRELRLRPDRGSVTVVLMTNLATASVHVGEDTDLCAAWAAIGRECEILRRQDRIELIEMRRRASGGTEIKGRE